MHSKTTLTLIAAGLMASAFGSYYVLLGPDAPPKGWEANHVQTLPGRGWFPYMLCMAPLKRRSMTNTSS
ncbi:MAG: hypothetical protein WBN43_12145, partial [Thiogranum sp.]